ncbi:MAG: DoxX family protein [Planctomycetes bacterium]|nr:DoxX family protein [Planctomycetota bacterium]
MQSIAFLILRLTFGLGFAVHGYQSLFVIEGGMEGLTGLVASRGWPAPEAWAYLAKITELVGGLLVALGFLTRTAALACAGTMGVAIYMVHLDHPFRDSAGGPGWELAGLYLAAFLAILFTGAGKISIDRFRRDSPPLDDPAPLPPFSPGPAYEVSKPAATPTVHAGQPVQGSDAVWDGEE